jgi:hypothetical protein
MRQGNGTALLGLNDPRGANIGIIYVSPTDDRKSVLAALITQEKLGRKQVAVVLPNQNKAFQHPIDFDDLKGLRRKLQTQIVFIAPDGPGPAEFARQRRFPVYPSLESYARALREEEQGSGGKKLFGFFSGGKQKPHEKSKAGQAAPANSSSNGTTTRQEEPGPLILGTAGLAGTGIAAAPGMRGPATQHPADASATPLTIKRGDEQALPPAHTPVNSSISAGSTQPAQQAPTGTGMHTNNGGYLEPRPIDLTPKRTRTTAKLPTSTPAAPLPLAPNPSSRPGTSAPSQGRSGTAAAAASNPPPTGSTATKGGASPMQGNVGGGGTAGGGGGIGQAKVPRRRKPTNLLVALLLLLLTLFVACAALAYIKPSIVKSLGINNVLPDVLSSNVTVTIIPSSQTIANSYVITGVTGTANPAQEQISIQPVSYTTPATTVQVMGTGVHTIPATTAHGTLSFTNGSTSPYTFGTTTPFVASNGVTFYLDAPVTIPAANLQGGTVGTATGTAHAANPGSNGNIPAGAINITNTFTVITNPGPFTGGQDAQHYTFIQQSDVEKAVASVQSSLLSKAQAGLKARITAGEQLVNSPQCQPSQSVNQPIGDQGTNIPSATATVTETCIGQVYKQSDLDALAKSLLSQKAQATLGAGYGLVGNIVTQTSVQNANQGKVSLLVNAKGVWAYQFSEAQKQALAQLIKGQSRAQAITTLKSQTGIEDASLPSDVTTLPTDPRQITITVQEPTGFSGGGTGPAGATPTLTGPGTGTPTPVQGNGSVPLLM